MKFDSTRNKAELSEIVDALICVAIGGGLTVIFGAPWLACIALVFWIGARWKRTSGRSLRRQRAAALAALAACSLVLAAHWSSYRDGVIRGYHSASHSTSKQPD